MESDEEGTSPQSWAGLNEALESENDANRDDDVKRGDTISFPFRDSSSTTNSDNAKSISFVSTIVSPPVRDKPRDMFKGSFSVDNRTRTPIFPFPKTRRNQDEEPRLRGIFPPQYHTATTMEADVSTAMPPPPASAQPQSQSSYSPPVRGTTNLSNVSNNSPYDDNLSTQSHLFGECISVTSSHPRANFMSFQSSLSNMSSASQAAAEGEEESSQWHDVELGETSPLRTKNESTAGARSSAAFKLRHFLASNPRIAALLNQANGRVLDVAHTASRELEHMANAVLSQLARWFPITVLQSELSFLKQVHRLKMEQLKCSPDDDDDQHLADDDYYDFCLILSSQQVYEFWADLLDFRAEYLGDASVENLHWIDEEEDDENVSPTNSADQPTSSSTPTSGTQCSSGSEENHHSTEGEDVVQPLMTTSPSTGIRRRKGTDSNTPRVRLASYDSVADKPQSVNLSKLYSPAVLSVSGSYAVRPTSKRQSLFERAVGPFSPPRTLSKSRLTLYDNNDDDGGDDLESNKDMTPTPLRSTSMNTPSLSHSGQRRRRWGNYALNGVATSTVNLMSPPVYELQRAQSMRPRRPTMSTPPSSLQTISSPNSALSNNNNNDSQKQMNESERRRQQRRSLRIEDIPTQVIPRGIAARTNGMLPFLSALKRGIVVRKHRANVEAVFCKLLSKDGGDTIEYHYITKDEAMLAFKEQRVRYNKKFAVAGNDGSQSWSRENVREEMEDADGNKPDFIAAEQYRKRWIREHAFSKRIVDAATKAANSGSVRTSEIIRVHPAWDGDPRSSAGLNGTASLRKSKSEYNPAYSFSLITRVGGTLLKGKSDSLGVIEKKWCSGEGSDIQFSTVDFEAATEGEYWLIFRGFLLLHRDAAVGRFASDRAAGIGNNFNRRELEQREEIENLLHKDEFYEPVTVGCLERTVVNCRKLDTTYMTGEVLPTAVPPPSDYFLGFRSKGTQIWSRLRQAGLETQRIYNLDRSRVLLKIRCPPDRLLDVAEVLRLKLRTREGSFAPFRENDISMYEPLDDALETPSPYLDGASLFRSSDRQTIIDFIIRSRIRDSGAELGQTTDLGKMIHTRAPLHMRAKLDSIFKKWCLFWRRDYWNGQYGSYNAIESSVFSGVLEKRDENFGKTDHPSVTPPNLFYRVFIGSFFQPLDSVEQYFGEQVAFYFAWLQHCAIHLVFLSVVGVIVFIIQASSGRWDHPIRPFYSMFVMLWSFVVMVNWRKRSNYLAYRWGTMDYKEQETTRPQFRGAYERDEITREWVVVYPTWKRWVKYLISFPMTLVFTIGTLVGILWVHANRDLQLARYIDVLKNSTTAEAFEYKFSIKAIGQKAPLTDVSLSKSHLFDPTFWVITVGLPGALGLALPLLNFILMRVSVMLNDFENYRTESEYRTHLIIKVFSFRFVCYFATLYYYAALSTDTPQAVENGMFRIGTGVLVYTTAVTWWTQFLQNCFPWLIRRIRLFQERIRLRDELKSLDREEKRLISLGAPSSSDKELEKIRIQVINTRLLLDQAQDMTWDEITLPAHDSFPEYIQAVVQFAYVACFSVVMPITPLICLFNYLVSMRLDAYKLCRGRRRPLAQKTGGIGVWEHVLHIVTVIAVLTNCWLMGFTNAQFSWIAKHVGNMGLFALVVGWEHIMLLIKYMMQTSISKLPKAVKDEMKREQYQSTRKRNSSLMRATANRRSQMQRDGSCVSFADESSHRRSVSLASVGRAGSILRNAANSKSSNHAGELDRLIEASPSPDRDSGMNSTFANDVDVVCYLNQNNDTDREHGRQNGSVWARESPLSQSSLDHIVDTQANSPERLSRDV